MSAAIVLVNSLFYLAALLGEADPFHHALGAHPSGGLVERLLTMHDHGYTIAGIFFGLCLLPLGSVAYRSSRIPRVLSTLLTISLILDTLIRLLWPDLPALIHTLIAPPPVADLWLTLYMVTKGGLGPRRARTAVAPARAEQAAAARPTPSCGASQAGSRTDGASTRRAVEHPRLHEDDRAQIGDAQGITSGAMAARDRDGRTEEPTA